MKTTKMLAILVLVLGLVVWPTPRVYGAQYLTVNGEDVDSITLELGQSCTIEVVSDEDDFSYAAHVGFADGLILGDFSHLETTSEAGHLADVAEPTGLMAFSGYYVSAAGFGLLAGVHFVFQYQAQQIGETYVRLYDETLASVMDSVHITVIGVPMGTAFTYQGRLIDAADGLYDFMFKLFNHLDAGTQQGSTIFVSELDVRDGHFTVELDFGSGVFNGDARWLEIGVRPGLMEDPEVYTVLLPRKELKPVPYALHTRGIFLDDDWPSNIFVGHHAGRDNTTGHHNTFLGMFAGHSQTVGMQNTFVGYEAGRSNVTGRGNVFIGNQAGKNEGGSNKLYIANNSGTPLIYGDFSTGRVGIGTTSPEAKLHVTGAGGAMIYGINSSSGDGVYGYSPSGDGVEGSSNIGNGVYGRSDTGYAGYFRGRVAITGDLKVTGVYKGDIGPNLGAPFPRPAYDSGWQQVEQGTFKTFVHDIGGNVDNYVVDLQFDGGAGISNAFYGTEHYTSLAPPEPGYVPTTTNRGAYWCGLTTTQIKVYRASMDFYALRVRVRIWVYN